MFHTIHTAKLATQLNKLCASRSTPLRVMAQVNTSREPSTTFFVIFLLFFSGSKRATLNIADKNGALPENCTELVQHIITSCPLLEFSGLMTIGDYDSSSTEHSLANPNPDFQMLKKCKIKVCQDLALNPEAVGISMGMSSDYEHAVRPKRSTTNTSKSDNAFSLCLFFPFRLKWVARLFG